MIVLVYDDFAEHIAALHAADIDGDGDEDLFVALAAEIQLYAYEGSGHFTLRGRISIAQASAVLATDSDQDGDQDIAVASPAGLVWLENLDGAGDFGHEHGIASPGSWSAFLADLDGDDDEDVLASHATATVWYENTDGFGTFGPPRTIGEGASSSIRAADLDGDGDQDVVAIWQLDDQLCWFENRKGGGDFGPRNIIHTVAPNPVSIVVADLDVDGDPDLLSSFDDRYWSGAKPGCHLAWFENEDGRGSFAAERYFDPHPDWSARGTFAADLDGDDIDEILVAANWSTLHYPTPPTHGMIGWFDTGVSGGFASERAIAARIERLARAAAADLDGDGDQDVVSAPVCDGAVAWYERAPALAVSRNFGANPASFRARNGPALGGTSAAFVDLAGTNGRPTGHTYATLAGYASPLTFVLPGGQTLLIDPTDPGAEILGWPVGVGPVAEFRFPIPDDPSLAGLRLFTQAAHLGGVSPFALSNALDLTLGH
ncbi:MAG: VCBS repeat-containing protein [Planctomycetota bacterium]